MKIVLLGAFMSSWTQMWIIVTASPALHVFAKNLAEYFLKQLSFINPLRNW